MNLEHIKLVDEILEGLRLESSVFSRMTLFGDWGFAKDALNGAPFHLVLEGEAWLSASGSGEPVRMTAGDIAILPLGEPHRLLSRPDAPAVPWMQVADSMGWTHWKPGMRFKALDLQLGFGSTSSTLISGVFAFGDHRRNPFFKALPSVLVLRSGDDSEAARTAAAIIPLLDGELLSGKPGAETVGIRLADILFIQVIRHHLSSTEALPQGWLRGMTDAEIAPALSLMQRFPERDWSVGKLARELAMSRSRFAARFNEVVGHAPLEFLTDLRMHRAAQSLADEKVGLATLAESVGYSSQESFSRAFKRWSGTSPAMYRRHHGKHRLAASSSDEGTAAS